MAKVPHPLSISQQGANPTRTPTLCMYAPHARKPNDSATIAVALRDYPVIRTPPLSLWSQASLTLDGYRGSLSSHVQLMAGLVPLYLPSPYLYIENREVVLTNFTTIFTLYNKEQTRSFVYRGHELPCNARALTRPPMHNLLSVGSDQSAIIERINSLDEPFLLVDDGTMIDTIELPKRRKITRFDVNRHSFNPLKKIDYLRARQFVDLINAIFPEGDNTLTKRSATYFLLEALRHEPQSLDTLFPVPRKGDPPGLVDARQKIDTLLLSDVLSRVLGNPTNFSFEGILLARLDRAKLGRFDCFVLANLLISQYQGQVVIPDFGFYGCSFHQELIDQGRLIAGVNYLDETPFKNELLLMEEKIGNFCLYDDAVTLAKFKGLMPDPTKKDNPYNNDIKESMGIAA